MIIDSLQTIVKNNPQAGNLYLRNLLKEMLQYYTLNFVYTSVWGDQLLFKGGTCLRFCFDLPRLSEDLDFDIKKTGQFVQEKFLTDLTSYFSATWQFKDFSLKTAGNDRQITLKFPVMKKLGLATSNDSDVLFLRIDLAPVDNEIYREEISLKATWDFNFLIKRYSLEDLFASKITAILNRTFKKGKNDQITFKGRDYYDLIWFLQKGAKPNMNRLEALNKKPYSEIKKELDEKVAEINPDYLFEDLRPLFADEKFVREFCQNFEQLYQNLQFS
jgi:predicted nucleotidyltransferase component of viral defense system